MATTTVLVTGANKGIGYAICQGLGALGWRVGVGARDDSRRDAAVRALQAEGVDAFGVPLDVTDPVSVAAAAMLLETQEGGLDVLVNNAAITGGAPQEPTLVDPETVLRVVDTNVVGVIRVTNAVLPLLRRSSSPAHRQYLQQRRVADDADGPAGSRRADLRGVLTVEDLSQRGHRPVRKRAGRHPDPGQHGLPTATSIPTSTATRAPAPSSKAP